MHAVLVVIQMLVAIGMISVILLQRSEGGALGMGGGPGGLMSGRQAGNVLTRATTILAFVFFVTCIALTIFANVNAGGGPSVLDRAADAPLSAPAGSPAAVLGADQLGGDLLGQQPAGEPTAAAAPVETTAAPAEVPAAPAETPVPAPTAPDGQ